ncbi:MAG: hypothetical protein MUF21_06850 [Gemmatimonadaceae bacterium]|nr:hypothetical protein [Gemmatimonadaceae bacterium]
MIALPAAVTDCSRAPVWALRTSMVVEVVMFWPAPLVKQCAADRIPVPPDPLSSEPEQTKVPSVRFMMIRTTPSKRVSPAPTRYCGRFGSCGATMFGFASLTEPIGRQSDWAASGAAATPKAAAAT